MRRDEPAVSESFMASNAMAVATNASYSVNLALSDFYLFGHMKGLFGRESFETGTRVLLVIEGFLRSLAKWTLTKIFLEWMRKLEQYIETDDDYVW
jgi:hypothetical protein